MAAHETLLSDLWAGRAEGSVSSSRQIGLDLSQLLLSEKPAKAQNVIWWPVSMSIVCAKAGDYKRIPPSFMG